MRWLRRGLDVESGSTVRSRNVAATAYSFRALFDLRCHFMGTLWVPLWYVKTWASVHQVDGCVTARSRDVWTPRESGLDFSNSNHSEIWQVHTSAALPTCLANIRTIWAILHSIARFRDFTRFGGKTSYRLVNKGPGSNRYSWVSDTFKPLWNS